MLLIIQAEGLANESYTKHLSNQLPDRLSLLKELSDMHPVLIDANMIDEDRRGAHERWTQWKTTMEFEELVVNDEKQAQNLLTLVETTYNLIEIYYLLLWDTVTSERLDDITNRFCYFYAIPAIEWGFGRRLSTRAEVFEFLKWRNRKCLEWGGGMIMTRLLTGRKKVATNQSLAALREEYGGSPSQPVDDGSKG